MRMHEIVIVAAMLFVGSNAAGAMARRDAPLKVSDFRTSSPPASTREGEIVASKTNPCARTADYAFRCDPARPRALDAGRIDSRQPEAAGRR